MPDTHFYRYDDYDRTLVSERVEQFRDQVRRRLAGELTEEQFKPLRLHERPLPATAFLHAADRHSLRHAVGAAAPPARGHRAAIRRGYGHFTTRQNLQLNWIRLEDAPDALAALAEVDMHAMQTSGNCIRNVTADHYAGAADRRDRGSAHLGRDRAPMVDAAPRVHLPAAKVQDRHDRLEPNDRAAVRVHDIGLRLWRNQQGEIGFEVIVGGGLGRTPMIGKTLREFLPKDELLAYLESTLRVYNRYGRRDNLYKARIKILVHEVGAEKMREEVEAEYTANRRWRAQAAGRDDRGDRTPVRAAGATAAARRIGPGRGAAPQRFGLRAWLKSNVAPHRVPGYAIVTAR
jgi:sulfite reductase (NADPH) hemoprotein beta-component